MHKNQLRELLNHGTPAFPVAMYNNYFEEDTIEGKLYNEDGTVTLDY